MRLPPEETRLPRIRRGGRRRVWLIAILAILLIVLLSLQGVATFYTNYLWYRSERLTFVWRTIVEAKLELAAVFILVMFVAMWVSMWFADRLAPRALLFSPDLEMVRRYQQAVGPHAAWVRTVVAAVMAFLVGSGAASQWQNWILFTHSQSFPHMTDPIFGRNDGYFVFKLPFLTFLVDWLMLSLVVILIITAISHYLNGSIRLQGTGRRVDPVAVAHLSLILGLLALVKAISYYYVQRLDLEYSTRGVVQGAGYTDIHVELPALTLLAVVAFAVFATLIYNVYHRSFVLPLIGIGLWALIALVIGFIYPALIQALKVTPSQSTLELPYINENIKATRYGFALTSVEQTPFAAGSSVSQPTLSAYADTLNDADLWDPAIATQTYNKLQDLRSYFDLSGLAVDRYDIDNQLTPVIVGVRTLSTSGIPSASWVNTHLQYTHGYGVVLSPANTAATNGNPNFDIDNVPPQTQNVPGLPQLTQPRVYFGTASSSYVIVDSAQPEIDYTLAGSSAAAAKPVQSHYTGTGGVPISSLWTRLAFALRFHDLNLLISKLVTPSSKMIFVQNVQQMVQKAAPFLQVDSNPYPVIANGDIYWMVDAYTTTSYLPYSQDADTSALSATSGLQGTYNYVRNSVKVVINAYTGQMNFYIVPPRPGSPPDPLILAYQAAFPGLFQQLKSMPASLQQHLRYPQDLLTVQSAMYGKYHITTPSAFYSAANAWEIAQTPGTGSPSQPLPTAANGSVARFTPVYEILQLGGTLQGAGAESFDVVEPLVPSSTGDKLQTLAGFLVAGCDSNDYGALTVYTTPQGIDGPALVDAEINSNTTISTEISLLDAHGSAVSLGSVLMLPIDGSLFYVRPLYVSSSQNPFPQLQDVIVVYGSQVGMEKQLSGALSDVFNAPVVGVGVNQNGTAVASIPALVSQLVQEASAMGQNAEVALKAGNLGQYQVDENQVEQDLSEATSLLKTSKSSASGSNAGVGASERSPHVFAHAGGHR
jgi:uncharacterized protein